MPADVKLDNESVVIEGQFVMSQATDFMLNNDSRRKSYVGGFGLTIDPKPYTRRALVHGLKDQLIVNYDRDYRGGVLIQGMVRIEALYGASQNAVVCKTTDLILDSAERRAKEHQDNKEMRRALVHDLNDQLTLNYAGDYPGGVKIEGSVNIPGRLTVGLYDVASFLMHLSKVIGDLEKRLEKLESK